MLPTLTFVTFTLQTVTMKVPVQKVKFICHDKHDSSLFGVILATDRITSDSQRLHRLFCYQSDAKIVSGRVHVYAHCCCQ